MKNRRNSRSKAWDAFKDEFLGHNMTRIDMRNDYPFIRTLAGTLSVVRPLVVAFILVCYAVLSTPGGL